MQRYATALIAIRIGLAVIPTAEQPASAADNSNPGIGVSSATAPAASWKDGKYIGDQFSTSNICGGSTYNGPGAKPQPMIVANGIANVTWTGPAGGLESGNAPIRPTTPGMSVSGGMASVSMPDGRVIIALIGSDGKAQIRGTTVERNGGTCMVLGTLHWVSGS
jgi:hypothetical protein